MKNLALELQKYDYLFTGNHFFWNPELKYLYFNKNKDYELFFQFFIHILKYWTIDEILFYFKMDNIFGMQKNRDLKLDIYNIDQYKNNIEIKNKIDTIFKGLDILDYKPKIINDKTPLMREIERIVVIKGYSNAFDYLLNSFNENDLNIEYIKDFYQKMWKPSFDINGLPEISQRSFRTTHKIMRGAIGYSMPESQDIYDLVDIFIKKVNSIKNPISKAIVTHFLFAPIQAFEDGNGRVSRFLMNYQLLNHGYNYLTITDHDYRLKYLSNYGKDKEKLIKTFEEFYKFIYNQVT